MSVVAHVQMCLGTIKVNLQYLMSWSRLKLLACNAAFIAKGPFVKCEIRPLRRKLLQAETRSL